MKRALMPFNVSLINLDGQRLQQLKPVRVLDTYDGATTTFHDDGLFSTAIFGRLGAEERELKFSYVDIKVEIFHPIVFRTLTKLKGLYGEILSGRGYAVWDDQLKDFVRADEITGDTGYYYFINKWKDIVFKETGSDERAMRIKLMSKYRDNATTTKILIIPAGLRDREVNPNGRDSEDEINTLYRRVISVANTIPVGGAAANSPALDTTRYSLQMAFNSIYDYLEVILTGKKGFFQSKWGSRRIFNGTRNVISSMATGVSKLGDQHNPGINSTMLGLYQTAKGALPLTIHFLQTGWLSKVFTSEDNLIPLVDKKTLRREFVRVRTDVYDRWATPEGLEKVTTGLKEPSQRNKPIEINGYYLGLVYKGPDNTFKIFGDITELPEHLSKKDVYPLTLTELVYLSGYRRWNTLPILVTRYPITEIGSIYLSKVYIKTTVKAERRMELGEEWSRLGDDYVACEYPTGGDVAFVDTMLPHPSRLGGLGAD